MEQDKQPKRVKNVDAQTHRAGTHRAAIKPHKRSTASEVKSVISSYMGSVKTGTLKQTYYGDTITKNAAALRINFGLAADDEPYLLTDPTGSGRAGMLLSSTGVHLADGRGGTAAISWKELPSCSVGYQRGMLVIGKGGIASTDGQALVSLLQQIQTKLA